MRPSMEERFWDKVEKGETCWPWRGTMAPNGYGQFWVGGRGGRPMMAHRVSYELVRGPIPAGLTIHHECETKACVNPAHMTTLTRQDHSSLTNKGRKWRKRASFQTQTHCKHGHEWTAENTYVNQGWRQCRECNRLACARYHEARRRRGHGSES